MSEKNSSASKKSLLTQWRNRKSNPKSATTELKRMPAEESIPLSFGQRQLWFLQQLNPQNPFYHYADAYRFKGKLDVEILSKSFREVAARHDILRTTFEIKDNLPFQKIHQESQIEIKTLDLRHLSPEKRNAKANELAIEDARKPFDLEEGPLTRITILRLAEDESLLVLCMHHIVTDKWSMRILREELSEIYQALSQNQTPHIEPLAIQYGDFSYWKISQPTNEKSLNYWKEKLSGELPLLNLPMDKTRPVMPTYKGGYHTKVFSLDISKKLSALAKENNTTLFHLLLTAYKILLNKYTDQEDILIGTPITNRDQTSLEKLIGFFNDTVVLRSNLSDNPSFLELLGKVRQTTLDAFSNKSIPFETLVKELQPQRKLSVNPIFQSMFLFHQVPETPSFGEGLEVAHEPFDFGVSKFDLTLYISEDKNQLSAIFEYASDLFEEATIERMQTHFHNLLENIVANPHARLDELSIISQAEQDLIFSKWNNTQASIPDVPNIHTLIEQHALQSPNSTAVVFDNKKWTYQELNEQAEKVALHLQELGVQPDMIVGLCTARSFEMIVGIVGILKAGGAYLPLDPDYPPARINFMTQDANASIILTQQHLKNNFSNSEATVVSFEEIPNSTTERTFPKIKKENRAYLIYTSGSTGKPKGVVITHQNLIHSTTARAHFYKQSPDAFLLLSSYSFDSSVVGIFWTLCYGGALVIPPKRIEQDMNQLAELIFQNKVTHTLLLPSLYNLVLEYAPTEKLMSLKTVMVAGESCGKQVVENHFSILPQVKLYNEYGPTEATVWCIAHKIHQDDFQKNIPIGRPIPNTQSYIVDKNFQLVPVGVVGELYIGGEGISPGYLGRSELTEERFIANPFDHSTNSKLYKTGDLASYRADGVIDFHGRADYQIKIRGYRIELDEIKKAILANPNIQDAVVLIQQDKSPTQNEENEIEEIVKVLQSLSDDETSRLLNSIEHLSS